jgi:ribosome-associated translation inhibitor RaiA
MTFDPSKVTPRGSTTVGMAKKRGLAEDFDVEVVTRDELPGIADYARRKIGGLGQFSHQPVLFARVKLTKLPDPAVERPMVAQANLDVDGRVVRAQVAAATAREAIDRLEARLRRRLQRAAENWEARRGSQPVTDRHEWRHGSEPTHRPSYFPRPVEKRRIIRHKSFTLGTLTVDEAADEMDLLDYDFHLFTERGTGQDSVLYRVGPTGYRLAQVTPVPASRLAPFELPVTLSTQPAPRLTAEQAIERLVQLGLPFVFFVDAQSNRGNVLYHRYDGHYGLITPATSQPKSATSSG